MPYDQDLVYRIREVLAGERDVTEKRMFGGLAFLVGGHIAVAASGQGGLMVRVPANDTAIFVASGKAQPFVMRGVALEGWLRVSADRVRTKRQLDNWVALGLGCARNLPPKKPAKKRPVA